MSVDHRIDHLVSATPHLASGTARVARLLLDLDIEVARSETPALVATIRTRGGDVEIR